MTTLKKKASVFDEIRYHWTHSRPYTKRVRLRFSLGIIGVVVIKVIAEELHFPHWLGLVVSSIPLIYMLREFLVWIAADFNWAAREKDAKLGKLLASPDLHQRFTALSLRLHGGDAEELSQLQDAMKYGAREAQQLAEAIRKYEGISIEIRERQNEDLQSAEALAKLLDGQVERVAEIIEHKGRRNQWLLLITGAILGVAVQALAQWIF